MRRVFTLRKDVPRASNIKADRVAMRLAENDLVVAIKLNKNLPKVPVQYGEDVILNVPSIALEDVPVQGAQVNSKLGYYAKELEAQLKEEAEALNDESVDSNINED